ncbi:hemolysin family protein [Paenibacillus turpanensis]|uniref:hemolysin family protein n=1 Tax=Paenibacillus turpanensis TaxID=2689078 RepID=UPI0014094C25|nr:hemolysin family protein [Paenibacillus turpanensis]
MFELFVLIVLIFVNAFFAASEIALISLNDVKVKAEAEEGDRKAILLYALLQEPSKFLATIQIGITLAGFMASAFAADSFSESLAAFAAEAGVPLPFATLDAIAVILITLVLSYFTLVFGELVPKRLAMKKAELISSIAARPLTILSRVTAPFVALLTASTNLTVRLFGVDPDANEEKVTEEEIRMMVDIGKERGAIQEAEKMMIDNIFEFNNKVASDIMTHRINIVAIPVDISLEKLVALMNEEQFTRYPVYDGGYDHIIGILHVKSMMPYLNHCDDEPFDIRSLIYKPYHVPSSRRTDELFREMQQNNVHMVVVIDEYGGTAGIVTIEDLLEEIVGNIFDEYDEITMEFEKVDDHTYVIEGTVSLEFAGRLLRLSLPVEAYDTLGGFIVGEIGRLPVVGEELEYGGALFKVAEVGEKRISRVKVLISQSK